MTSVPKKVIWAVDALSEDLPLQQKAAKLLKVWGKKHPISIEPVYVMSPDQLGIHPSIFTEIVEDSKKASATKVQKIVTRANLTNVSPTKLLISTNFSLRNAIETLLKHAREVKADLIVASTQSKKGVSRFFFGSFAESLVLQSEIPVILVSPKTLPSSLNHVLFATDLSERSMEAFRAALKDAFDRRFKITIYNKVEYLTEFSMDTLGMTTAFQQIMDEDVKRRKTKLDEMVATAEKAGVKAEAMLDNKSKEVNPADAILKAAKKVKADAIAMGSQSGPIVSAILGSVTRNVVRGATVPVWVIHPKGDATNIAKNQNISNPIKKGAVAV